MDAEAEAELGLVQELVTAVRRVRSLTMVGERLPLRALVAAPSAEVRAVLEAQSGRAKALAILEDLSIAETVERPPASAVAVGPGFEVLVPLSEDVDFERLKEVLGGRHKKAEGALGGLRKKLSNEGFLRGADPDVVAAEKARMAEFGPSAICWPTSRGSRGSVGPAGLRPARVGEQLVEDACAIRTQAVVLVGVGLPDGQVGDARRGLIERARGTYMSWV